MAKVGRPRIIESPEEFEERAEAYFAECRDTETVVTITGLALSLGFCDRQSLDDYQARPEFSAVVKRARTIVESDYEQRLATSKPTGAIFALKNMGWSDKQQVEHSGKVEGGVLMVPAPVGADAWAAAAASQQAALGEQRAEDGGA